MYTQKMFGMFKERICNWVGMNDRERKGGRVLMFITVLQDWVVEMTKHC